VTKKVIEPSASAGVATRHRRNASFMASPSGVRGALSTAL
jgi:hypothetical protein